jgi:hypothetical protein
MFVGVDGAVVAVKPRSGLGQIANRRFPPMAAARNVRFPAADAWLWPDVRARSGRADDQGTKGVAAGHPSGVLRPIRATAGIYCVKISASPPLSL